MSHIKNPGQALVSTPTDSDLRELVWEAILSDSRIDPSEVNVVVEGGMVYLSGTVDSAAERKAVQESTEAVVARDKIVDRLTLRNFVERTEEELCAAVLHAMRRDLDLCADGVRVSASGSVVTLDGSVHTYREKNAAENTAWWTPGVTEVISRLRVEGVSDPPDEPDY